MSSGFIFLIISLCSAWVLFKTCKFPGFPDPAGTLQDHVLTKAATRIVKKRPKVGETLLGVDKFLTSLILPTAHLAARYSLCSFKWTWPFCCVYFFRSGEQKWEWHKLVAMEWRLIGVYFNPRDRQEAAPGVRRSGKHTLLFTPCIVAGALFQWGWVPFILRKVSSTGNWPPLLGTNLLPLLFSGNDCSAVAQKRRCPREIDNSSISLQIQGT